MPTATVAGYFGDIHTLPCRVALTVEQPGAAAAACVHRHAEPALSPAVGIILESWLHPQAGFSQQECCHDLIPHQHGLELRGSGVPAPGLASPQSRAGNEVQGALQHQGLTLVKCLVLWEQLLY